MAQTWEAGFDAFPTAIALTRTPVLSVTSITYIDATGTLQTLSSALYTLTQSDSGFASITPVYGAVWPSMRGDIDGIKVRYVAGYANAASVPDLIKSWVYLQVGAMYENREAEVVERGSAISLGFADRLLDRYRVWSA